MLGCSFTYGNISASLVEEDLRGTFIQYFRHELEPENPGLPLV
jgi:hypothetical protein